MSLKILSWNIWQGKYLPQVIDFLKRADANIIGLQEITQNTNGTKNIADQIVNELGYEWTYATTSQMQKNGKTMDWGNAILSKNKITGRKTHVLSKNHKRTALEVTIQVGNTMLNVFNTHLLHTHQQPSQTQETQMDNLINALPKEKVILMGDLNATPQSNAIKKIKNVFKNADPKLKTPSWSLYKKGCVVCKPEGLIYRLDYILTSNDIKSSSFKVARTKGSDHLPVSAIITL